MTEYDNFLNKKSQLGNQNGFEPIWIPDFLYDFQKHLVSWAIRQGRGAIFADCGMGKTPMQLVWAENIVRHTNGKVLIVTPLAVSSQTVREGAKFGIGCHVSREGSINDNIVITNYERLHYFDRSKFVGVVLDESSAIKHFTGARQKAVTQFMTKIPYRLLCTATAAPNDYIELGTASEALGQLGRMDMLGMFFMNDEKTLHPMWGLRRQIGWRFKGHAEVPFWRWVASWARAMRKPSDYGFDDGPFILPPLNVSETIVDGAYIPDGMLFKLSAITLKEQRDERKGTTQERCERVAELVSHKNPVVVWCQMNQEADLLEKIIPEAKQVKGGHSDEEKEERFLAFCDGQLRCLITKPRIGGFGMNWQHCNHMTMFPSHSFEQYYQSVRRCWRFGQKKPVKVDIITTEGEVGVLRNMKRKSEMADKMFDALIEHMNNALKIERSVVGIKTIEVPKWL